MPTTFEVDWSERRGPILHYEPSDADGVSQIIAIEARYCPFCGLDMERARKEWLDERK